MDAELRELKSVLRSIVVSSAAAMDVRALQRDFRALMGCPIPVHKFGYRDVLTFLRERCSDSFLLDGPPVNPVLTLIVPECLKHIDKFVQRQKPSTHTKVKGKRRSVAETAVRPPSSTKTFQQSHNICDTFKTYKSTLNVNKKTQINSVDVNNSFKNTTEIKTSDNMTSKNMTSDNSIVSTNVTLNNSNDKHQENDVKQTNSQNLSNGQTNTRPVHEEQDVCSNDKVRNFLKKRLPIDLDEEETKCGVTPRDDGDSGRLSMSSESSSKRAALEELQSEIHALVSEHRQGVPLTQLMAVYRARYGRELQFVRAGHHSLPSLLCAMRARLAVRAGRVLDAATAPTAPAPSASARALRPAPASAPAPLDPDDALPGIDFDPDVFPADCMHLLESIPRAELDGVVPAALLEVAVGEVYSPSHFWLQRLGLDHASAMHRLMDTMSEYYSGEGASRVLPRAALRVGHYCAALYDGDWHRALIVRLLDAGSVKVRHVDYGTVETVPAASLKPLLRRYAALPAQAVRARLAGLRPGAAARRWPHAASAHFLRLVCDKHFVASVVAVDHEEETLEVRLIDTSGADDVCVTEEMIRAGHADRLPGSVLQAREVFLLPRFEALESGDTPNFAEIHRYLADGIALDFVDSYRRHVPAALPALPTLPAPPPAACLSRLRLHDSNPESPHTLNKAPKSTQSLSPLTIDPDSEHPPPTLSAVPQGQAEHPAPNTVAQRRVECTMQTAETHRSPEYTLPTEVPQRRHEHPLPSEVAYRNLEHPVAVAVSQSRLEHPASAIGAQRRPEQTALSEVAHKGAEHPAPAVVSHMRLEHPAPAVVSQRRPEQIAPAAMARRGVEHPAPAAVFAPGVGPSAAPGPAWWSALSPHEREMYAMLCLLDPHAAHCYLLSAMRRAHPPPAPCRPPPGF